MPDDLSSAIQQDCLSLLTFNDEHGKIIAGLVQAELFEGDYRLIAERALRYWQQHQSAPKIHIYNEFEDVFGSSEHRRQAGLLRKIIVAMRDTADRANPAYVLGQLRGFIGRQRRKGAMLQMMERLNQNTPMEEIDAIYSEIMRADHNIDFEPGLRLTDVNKVMKFLERRQSEFITGIPEFDQRHVVPMRSAVSLWLAATGRGKSWALAHIGYQALLARMRVLHITLELTEEEVLQRFYQTMFRAAKHKLEDYEITALEKDGNGALTGSHCETGAWPQFHFASPYIIHELKARLAEMDFDHLIVKKFPMRGLTMHGLRAHLDRLERFDKFIPDMIIIDYIGVMHTDARDHRLSLGRVMEEFKGLCDERSMAGITAQQVNKIGAQADRVNLIHVAEAWSLTNTADQVIAYSATKEEGDYGMARLYVAKARSEMDKFGVLITQDYKTGQFVLDSILLPRDYFERQDRYLPRDQDRPRTQQAGGMDDDDDDESAKGNGGAGFIGLE